MLIGALLFVTWLVLLLRYPDKALPVSLAAVGGVALIAAWVLWQEQRTEQRVARLELRLQHAPADCPADRPLAVMLHNGSERPLLELHWRVAAYLPGDSVNLAEDLYDRPRYSAPGALQPGADWHACLPLPPLRHGYRPQTLEFRAERIEGRFAD